MRRRNVWVRLLLWRSSVRWGVRTKAREVKMWNLTRDSDQNGAQQPLSWTIYGEILTLVQRLRPTVTVPLIKRRQKKNLQFMQNVWVLRANHKSASNLRAQSETPARRSLRLTPLAESFSQSQSWLSLPRPNKSSTYEFVNQTFKQTSELIKTVCNVTVELAVE